MIFLWKSISRIFKKKPIKSLCLNYSDKDIIFFN